MGAPRQYCPDLQEGATRMTVEARWRAGPAVLGSPGLPLLYDQAPEGRDSHPQTRHSLQNAPCHYTLVQSCR